LSKSFTGLPSGSNKIKNLPPCDEEKKQTTSAELASKNKEMPIIESFARGQSFHASFLKLKKHLEMEMNVRKTQIDSLLKKCKSKFFKSIHVVLKKCFLFKLNKLPQNFITNIKIERNKKFMSDSLLQIYQAHGFLRDIDLLLPEDIVKKEKRINLKEFLNLSFTQAFDTYTKSEQFLRDYQSIKEKDGFKIAILFDFVSKIFINYFTFSKGNKNNDCCKKIKIKKCMSISVSSKDN
jgi:hypothetical protein